MKRKLAILALWALSLLGLAGAAKTASDATAAKDPELKPGDARALAGNWWERRPVRTPTAVAGVRG